MTATITANNGAGSVYPLLILGYEAEDESRNIIHDLVGGGIAAVLSTPRPRSGELQLLFADGVSPEYAWVDGYYVPIDPSSTSEAWVARALHREETTFSLIEPDRPEVEMTYVVAGAVRITLDDQTRKAWVVTVPYQEVEL